MSGIIIRLRERGATVTNPVIRPLEPEGMTILKRGNLMCYRCERCGVVSKPREPQFKRVIETRDVIHTDTYMDKEEKKHTVRSPGTQIIKELKVCKDCTT